MKNYKGSSSTACATPPHIELLERLRDQIVEERTPSSEVRQLPVNIFIDPERFAREHEKAFLARPVIVGHVSMIPEAGDHFTHDLLGKPLLIARDQDGEIRAFLNVCRHRGMRLVEAPGRKGAPSFVCPYHHWSYGMDGSLNYVPLRETFGDTDLSCHNLQTVRCEVHRGLIWVQLNDERPQVVSDWLGTIDFDLAAFDFASKVVMQQSTTLKKANWKLIIEAFQDGYHVTRLHKKTVGGFFLDSQAATESENEHIRSAVARKPFSEVLHDSPEQWDVRKHVSFSHFIFPNAITVLHPEYTSVLTLFPQSADETYVTHLFMANHEPKSKEEREHINRSFDLIENGVFQSEDYFVCEGIHAGLRSGANDYLLTGQHEQNLLVFHDILNRVIEV